LKYYKSNAVYEALLKIKNHQFVWVSGNAWTLVYADSNVMPKLLVLAYGASWSKQSDVIRAFEYVSETSGIPLCFIEFDDHANEIETVTVHSSTFEPTILSLEELKIFFHENGLPVNTGVCAKSINDAESSAYHKWQRVNLGNIVVTDIDLFRLDNERKPIEIIELKRSYYALNRWAPFSADFANFNLLLTLSNSASLKFHIAYNLRETKPVFNDDASKIVVFNYTAANKPIRVAELMFNDFVAGSY
jgi:hypothetical protein